MAAPAFASLRRNLSKRADLTQPSENLRKGEQEKSVQTDVSIILKES
jgi:hypothetical protein